MNEYEVSNYGIFDDAIADINALKGKIDSSKSIASECKSSLNGSALMGPLSDECTKGFSNLEDTLSAMADNYSSISGYLSSASSNYQSGDNSASSTVKSAGTSSSGTNLATTGSNTTTGTSTSKNNKSGSSTTTTHSSSTSNKKAAAAVDWAVSIANDDNYGYINGGMGNGGYDCTQFVHAAYEAAGISLPEKGWHNQTTIVDYYTQNGFSWHPGPIDPNELEAGDVLVNQEHHAEMYIGNGQKVGAHNDWDGAYGDSSGTEISIDSYQEYANGGWDGYLRYDGA